MKAKAKTPKKLPKISNVERHNVVRAIRKQHTQKVGRY